MAQATQKRGRPPAELAGAYALVQDEMAEVDQVLREELANNKPLLDRLLKHGFQLGGKRLRPALLLLSGMACGALRREHVQLAAAVEMIHTATLIHDDVLDEATIRRHLATVNAQWDNEASVLLGDYLFARALSIASSLDSTYACRLIADATQTMCEGEISQIQHRGDYRLNEQDYLSIISDKTAALLAACCRLGAYYAEGEPVQREALGRFGHELGIAFQITDDVLDVQGDEHTTGKSLGTDFLKQKATLPLIRLLERVSGDDRRSVLEILAHPDEGHRRLLRPWLEKFDVIGYSKEKARRHAQIAAEQLEELSETPAREALKLLADFVAARQQ
jgi:octaprenyl-diphosphate synthase